MLRKIHVCFTIFMLFAALIAVICTVLYAVVYGCNGDGRVELGIILGSWLVALWCGIRLPSIIDPNEDATSSLLEWFWPFN